MKVNSQFEFWSLNFLSIVESSLKNGKSKETKHEIMQETQYYIWLLYYLDDRLALLVWLVKLEVKLAVQPLTEAGLRAGFPF